jgi:hypothetical protein
VILEIAAADLPNVLGAFWRGSLGTGSALFSGTLVRAIPLAILGVAIAAAFRAGVFNIGGEGQLLLGAIAASVVGLHGASVLGPTTVVAAPPPRLPRGGGRARSPVACGQESPHGCDRGSASSRSSARSC